MSTVHSAVQTFLNERLPQIKKLNAESADAYWQASITGKKEEEELYSKKNQELLMLFSNREDFASIKQWLASDELTDETLRRQLVLLHNDYLPNQIPEEKIKQMVEKEVEISSEFTNFRPEINGERVSNNMISDILTAENDSTQREAAWRASKEIGEQVADKIKALVQLRNEVARELGYSSYHSMALETQELDETEMFRVLDQLKNETDEPFRQVKAKLDAELAARFGVPAEELQAWHYRDPFFQEAPPLEGLDLDPLFKDKDIEALCRQFFQDLGMDVADILANSDLYERDNKNQHAYCMDVDRSGDVRVLANIRDNEWWMSTMLHELGHAVYDKYNDPNSPYLLRRYAHILTTEAIAMLFGRLTKDVDWLQKYLTLSEAQATEFQEKLQPYLSLSMLIFVRWGLVMVYFERELYKNPEQDLNALWWKLVEELQFVKKPEGRNKPDWAAKIHIGTSPVYYQNYIFGELTASQLDYAIRQATGKETIISEEAGQWLVEKIFKPGASFHWNTMLEKATGELLNPEYFVKQFVGK
ncbi:M2 family metallopeptidase [Brevibacillus dissolubilis]|uniref:M2 family metallopeptidase n=1 Tax=Brevibacillus dissolubilis TaxID=1844116 RepID=UPI001116CFD2|nr:M2 family metallopeptidase [Brevibacillus dissolubilis]